MNQELIRRKTLDLLLRNVKSMEDLELIDFAIKDYENHHQYDLNIYKEKIKEMRNGCWQERR